MNWLFLFCLSLSLSCSSIHNSYIRLFLNSKHTTYLYTVQRIPYIHIESVNIKWFKLMIFIKENINRFCAFLSFKNYKCVYVCMLPYCLNCIQKITFTSNNYRHIIDRILCEVYPRKRTSTFPKLILRMQCNADYVARRHRELHNDSNMLIARLGPYFENTETRSQPDSHNIFHTVSLDNRSNDLTLKPHRKYLCNKKRIYLSHV